MAPRKIRPEIPRELEAICLCAIRKDPAKRYETCAEFAGDLERFLGGEPVHVRSAVSRMEWGRKFAAVGGIVVLILVLLGGTAMMLSPGISPRSTTGRLGDEGLLLFKKGMAHYEKAEYSDAVEVWTKVLEIEPEYAYGWYYRARAYEGIGKRDLAIRDMEHAGVLSPHNPIFEQELRRIRDGDEASPPGS